jgi:hypothetical protein
LLRQNLDTRQINENAGLPPEKQMTKGGVTGYSNGGIVSFTIVYWNVPGGVLKQRQDHTTVQLKFKDESVWYIDCGTLSTRNIEQLTGVSHFTPASGVPKNWSIKTKD